MSATDKDFAARIVRWQREHGRHDLPWQQNADAYRVWLSEVMLQQTQVATVVPYFLRFVERFPDVAALAAASIDEVLPLWAGLGYYARARNLHACAQGVVAQHAGRFPDSVEALAALPGIGRSTAGAIASLAYRRRAAILDGNVKRVLSRCFGVDGPADAAPTLARLWQLAESLLPDTAVGAYTQGLMDLGATLCTRKKPACERCPLAEACVARREDRVDTLPAPRRAIVRPTRQVTLLLIDDGRHFYLQRRPPAGIWGGLLSLPELATANAGETDAVVPDAALSAALAGLGLAASAPLQRLPELRHDFTHFRLLIAPVHCRVEVLPDSVRDEGGRWIAHSDAAAAGVPAPVARLLRGFAGDAAAPRPRRQA